MKNCIRLFMAGLACLGASCLQAQVPKVQGHWHELFAGPSSTDSGRYWLSAMKAWREDQRQKLLYSDSLYRNPALSWMKKTFVYVQMMAHDRYVYDPVSRKYTVDRYLDDLIKRYGGIDAVLIWPTYPNIGTDNRNQYDMLHDMPGGVAGVKQLVSDFHRRNVKVFFPIMIWDHGTRFNATPMPLALAQEMKEVDADGLIGDTMNGIGWEFKAASDSLGLSLVLQPELNVGELKMIGWNQMSWGYFWDFTYTPAVSIYKWFEPKHQVHVTNRWATNKINDLQYAFFNGIGHNPWENIWGVWNPVSERDAAIIRRIAAIYRRFPNVWSSAEWEPHVPVMQGGVFASRFPGTGKLIYTLVNRDATEKKGCALKLPYEAGKQYYDLWNGKPLLPERIGDSVCLSFSMEPNGFGAVLVVNKRSAAGIASFLKAVRTMAATPLMALDAEWKPLPQKMVPIPGTLPAAEAPEGMVLIPATDSFVFESKGVMVEGDELPEAVGVQHPWQAHPTRNQEHTITVAAFYMDKYPVTNKQFKQFMDATHYRPADDHNFLKDWINGNYPRGWDNKPVTWVSIEDARAYAKWAGKRLPHEWEWQYAAQGTGRRMYPWGNEMDSSRMPLPNTAREMRPPTDVDAYPGGANEFGLMDLVGNIWQWTDEYIDDRTRSAILKGGSYFRPQGSFWYFPQAYELNKYGKYLLMAPGLDRSGTIGFRLCRDK